MRAILDALVFWLHIGELAVTLFVGWYARGCVESFRKPPKKG